MLTYPHDRVNGFVLLSDGAGNLFVPDFTRLNRLPIEYCQAFMTLARRMDEKQPSEKE